MEVTGKGKAKKGKKAVAVEDVHAEDEVEPPAVVKIILDKTPSHSTSPSTT